MHPHEQLIRQFYTAFQRRDAAGMLECYHPECTFSDSVFVDPDPAEARAMWRMLVERGRDLELVFSDVAADDATGQAHWDATYTFSVTGKRVLNRIDARFEFKDGKIFRHRDTFDLWKWASQALGFKGKLLGWAPPVQNAVRSQARKGLKAYMRESGAAQRSTAH